MAGNRISVGGAPIQNRQQTPQARQKADPDLIREQTRYAKERADLSAFNLEQAKKRSKKVQVNVGGGSATNLRDDAASILNVIHGGKDTFIKSILQMLQSKGV